MKMKILVVAALSIFLFTGCAWNQKLPSICDVPDASSSYICSVSEDLGVRVEDIDLFFRIATTKTLSAEEKEEAVRIIDNLEMFVNSFENLTYTILVEELKLGLLDTDLIIIQDYIQSFYSPMLVSDFDKYLIITHLKRQREVLAR